MEQFLKISKTFILKDHNPTIIASEVNSKGIEIQQKMNQAEK